MIWYDMNVVHPVFICIHYLLASVKQLTEGFLIMQPCTKIVSAFASFSFNYVM